MPNLFPYRRRSTPNRAGSQTPPAGQETVPVSFFYLTFARLGDFGLHPLTRHTVLRQDQQQLVTQPNCVIDLLMDLPPPLMSATRTSSAPFGLQVSMEALGKLLVVGRIADEARVELKRLAVPEVNHSISDPRIRRTTNLGRTTSLPLPPNQQGYNRAGIPRESCRATCGWCQCHGGWAGVLDGFESLCRAQIQVGKSCEPAWAPIGSALVRLAALSSASQRYVPLRLPH